MRRGFFSPTLSVFSQESTALPKQETRLHFSHLAEAACWLLGLACSAVFLSQVVLGEVHRVQGIAAAEEAWQAPRTPPGGYFLSDNLGPDQSLWSESRIADYEASLTKGPKPILAVIDVPRLRLQAPVYAGELERGPGWIDGTALPGEPGNIGIAGHRDGYFRVLKDARLGDTITMRAPTGVEQFVVEDILIVDPEDVEVLAPTREPTITLVTCYPFYFVGSAPKRYIVRARLDEDLPEVALADASHQSN